MLSSNPELSYFFLCGFQNIIELNNVASPKKKKLEYCISKSTYDFIRSVHRSIEFDTLYQRTQIFES